MPKSNLYHENVVAQGAWRLSSSLIPSSTQCPNNPLDLWQRLPQKCSNLMNWHFLIKKICFLQSLLSSNKLTTSKDLSSQATTPAPLLLRVTRMVKAKKLCFNKRPPEPFRLKPFSKTQNLLSFSSKEVKPAIYLGFGSNLFIYEDYNSCVLPDFRYKKIKTLEKTTFFLFMTFLTINS